MDWWETESSHIYLISINTPTYIVMMKIATIIYMTHLANSM